MKQHYDTFWARLDDTKLASWQQALPPLLEKALNPEGNGNLPRWLTAMETIKTYSTAVDCDLHQAALKIGNASDLSAEQQSILKETLKAFHPWRKGPFNIHGIHIDTEWHSDWKWDRVRPHLAPLKGKKVLDIGCGSGYHLWRMAAEGTELAVGVDPSLLSMSQFLVLKHFIGESVPAYFLPLT
ncbi:MAG: DUF1698 domain-containing protein, partial [Gammaproteobacteria bacterium]|nr:DUF1698 domain-containing protein [Gammaproteobacteria bacterium]